MIQTLWYKSVFYSKFVWSRDLYNFFDELAHCAAIARPLGHCQVVERSKQSRQARGASGRSSIPTYTRSVHVDQAAEPSSPASPAPVHAHVPTTNQENVHMFPCLAARRQQCAARINSTHFFPGRWQSPHSSLVQSYLIINI